MVYPFFAISRSDAITAIFKSSGEITTTSGPFRIGDRVQLTDEKGKLYSINLALGGQFPTHKGWLEHEALIGAPEGSTFTTNAGTKYQAFRPLLTDFVLSMPRGATIVYPKDAALILGFAELPEFAVHLGALLNGARYQNLSVV